jgi:hypothetical protein
MKYRNFISFGIVLKHGENLVNMMNMTQKKRKIGMRKDGWRNKTKKLEKFMKKKKENVLWI